MADEPKAQELVGSLPKQSSRRKGGKEWDKKKVLPSSKHCSLAETGMPPNEVIARIAGKKKKKKKEDVMESRKKDAGVLTMRE